jgi:protein-disulfide isomerase
MFALARCAVLAALSAAAFVFLSALTFAQNVDVEELHKPGQLSEMALGAPDAPVTIVEYASMSCPHCAAFSNQVFDTLKSKYIDSGKVRFIFREFPHNEAGFPPAMVARCAPASKFFNIVDAYFERQQEWLGSSDVLPAVLEIAKEFGFSQQSFDACVSNQALFAALESEIGRGRSFGVRGTPTFFINGRKLADAPSLENLEQAIDPLL